MSRKSTAAKPASKVIVQSKAPVAKVASGAVSIAVDDDAIQKLAYEISQLPKSYDDFVWIFAEAELRLRPAYAMGNIFQTGGPVQIYPGKIVDKPKEDDVRALAGQIASQGTPVQDLHWFIAQRNFIINKAKGKR
jgi:hypothetical protein